MILRTCDRCGKQIELNETYYTLKKEPHSDRSIVPVILCGYDALNNANAPIGYTPEYCEACVNLAFEALKPPTDAGDHSPQERER